MFMLSAEDYDAELAERYGWINRASSAGQLGDFVRSLAHRIANFPTAGHAVKERVNAIALPTAEDIRRDSDLFIEVWPLLNTEERMQAVMKRGFQTREQKLTWAGWLAT